MTKGLKRYQQTGNLHFITFSCHGRLPYLGSAPSREVFEQMLEATRIRYRFCVCAYVIMPEHVHLLVSEPEKETLATVIKVLKQSVSRRLKSPAQKRFWLERYYDFNVHTEEKRIEKLLYMHQNPVARGLVELPGDWPWSSFRHFATGEVGAVEIESQWTAFRRGNQLPEHLRFTEKCD